MTRKELIEEAWTESGDAQNERCKVKAIQEILDGVDRLRSVWEKLPAAFLVVAEDGRATISPELMEFIAVARNLVAD